MNQQLFKLTDHDGRTYNRTQWGAGVTHGPLSGTGDLCGPGYFHAYLSPELSIFLNPQYSNFKYPILWEANGEIVRYDQQLKVGCRTLTTIRQLPDVKITPEHRMRFGILCATAVYKDHGFYEWATGWLSGNDQTPEAAKAMKKALERAFECRGRPPPPERNAAGWAAWNATRMVCEQESTGWGRGPACAASFAAHANPDLDLINLASSVVANQ